MKLLLVITILTVCHAAAIPDDPQQFYFAKFVFLEANALGITVRLLDDLGTTWACEKLYGSKSQCGCVLRGARSGEAATRKDFTSECIEKKADIEIYQDFDGALGASYEC